MILLTRRWAILVPLALLLAAPFATLRAADTAPKIGIKGYDPVAYFVDSGPRHGDAQYFVDHDGRRYLFASAANRDQFLAQPDRFLPQYAGFCASAMWVGARYEADPKNWRISDGRLFIFAGKNGAASFAANESTSMADADEHWRAITPKN